MAHLTDELAVGYMLEGCDILCVAKALSDHHAALIQQIGTVKLLHLPCSPDLPHTKPKNM